MKLSTLKKYKLPDKPGIYMFLDTNKKPIYIGRATSLKSRVRSYFGNDLISTRGPRIVDMVTKSKSIKFIEYNSVLETVIQEGILIRKYQPKYNVDDKDNKSSLYVVITDEKIPRVFTERVREFDALQNKNELDYIPKKVFGPYPHSGLIKESMKILRKLFPFKDRKSTNPKYEQFYVSIGRSPDLEDSIESIEEYNRTIKYLIKFFEGNKGELERLLKKDMDAQALRMDFESANRTKRTLYALKHINDIALIKKSENYVGSAHVGENFRIEAYDIAHISGSEKVGAMAVMENGVINKSAQRFFKIKDNKNDDIAGLIEILMRRLRHSEWRFPDLVVVDGGETQLKTAINILSANRFDIPVVAATKNEKHKVEKIIGDTKFSKLLNNEIVTINAEVHRLAINYHRRRMRNRI